MNENRARVRPTTIIAIGIVVLLMASGFIAEFYTDVLWYQELGQAGVFWRTLGWEWASGAVAAVLFFALLYANLRIARSMTPTTVFRIDGGPSAQFEEALQRLRELDRACGRHGRARRERCGCPDIRRGHSPGVADDRARVHGRFLRRD